MSKEIDNINEKIIKVLEEKIEIYKEIVASYEKSYEKYINKDNLNITPERVYKSSEEWRKLGRQDEVEEDL